MVQMMMGIINGRVGAPAKIGRVVRMLLLLLLVLMLMLMLLLVLVLVLVLVLLLMLVLLLLLLLMLMLQRLVLLGFRSMLPFGVHEMRWSRLRDHSSDAATWCIFTCICICIFW